MLKKFLYTLIFVFISFIAFGQDSDYTQANKNDTTENDTTELDSSKERKKPKVRKKRKKTYHNTTLQLYQQRANTANRVVKSKWDNKDYANSDWHRNTLRKEKGFTNLNSKNSTGKYQSLSTPTKNNQQGQVIINN